tara:strand:- start:3168 stop:3713 length:546 start_codon:yes stop_codon:yes gene_type:complete
MNNKFSQKLISLLKFKFSEYTFDTSNFSLSKNNVKDILTKLIFNIPLSPLNSIFDVDQSKTIVNGVNDFYALNFALNDHDPMLLFYSEDICVDLKNEKILFSNQITDKNLKYCIIFKDLLSTKKAFSLKSKLENDSYQELVLENYSLFADNIINCKLYLTTNFISEENSSFIYKQLKKEIK